MHTHTHQHTAFRRFYFQFPHFLHSLLGFGCPSSDRHSVRLILSFEAAGDDEGWMMKMNTGIKECVGVWLGMGWAGTIRPAPLEL